MRPGRQQRDIRRKTRGSGRPGLHCEFLESRYLLTSFTVNTTNDVVDANDGVTSLREAINQANAAVGLDEIEFDSDAVGNQFILITAGELQITDSLNINGLGNSVMGISVDDPSDTVGDGSRVFNINDGTPAIINVRITDMQIRDGDSTANGGAIYTEESLTLERIVGFSSDAAVNGGFLFASLSAGARLVIDNSTIDDNSAASHGGGISAVVYGGSVSIVNSIITGNTALGDGGGVYLYSDNPSGEITVSGTEVTNNQGDEGGGVMFIGEDGSAQINDSVISGNTARQGAGVMGALGGGDARLDVFRSLVLNNEATGSGGGIAATIDDAILNVSETRVTGNRADTGAGVGFRVIGAGSANIESSAIDANTSTGIGGGVLIDFQSSTGEANVVNSTISGNTSVGPAVSMSGGGKLAIRHSTIARNTSPTSTNAAVRATGTNLTISHTIIAEHSRDVAVTAGTFDLSYSLIGTNVGSGLTASPTPDAKGNRIGGVTAINPMLGDLGPNGGATDTHALLNGSPAIDGGADVLLDAPAKDQRGAAFIRVFDGDGDGTATIDIGAYERISSGLLVDTTDDESDGDYTAGDLSLREAVALAADRVSTSGVVTFAGALSGQTINLTMGQIRINNPVVIQGPGAENLSITAIGNDPTPALKNGDGSRVFDIDDGNVARNLPVTISGMTLTGGDVTGPGGAISSFEDLTLRDTVITGNHSALSAEGAGFDGDGGGIWARTEDGLIQIIDTVVSNNTSDDDGGGLNVLAGNGKVVIENSTVSGNSASGLAAVGPNLGGGVRGFADADGEVSIVNSVIRDNNGETLGAGDSWGGGGIGFVGDGLLSVTGSTISGNTSSSFGGGIYLDTGRLEIADTTISDNSASLGGGVALFFDGTATIETSTITGNTSGNGGGVFNLGLTDITGSTLSENTARFGGAIANGLLTQTNAYAGTVNVLNSTISGNTSEFGGGLFNIAEPTRPSTLRHVTMVNNVADENLDDVGSGGGIYTVFGEIVLDHSIVAANSITAGGAPDIAVDPDGIQGTRSTLTVSSSLIGDSFGSALIESITPDADGNLIGGPVEGIIDAMVGPLADNGGPTMTHALLDGSPAIDAGNVANLTGSLTSDQRGEPYVREFNNQIDIGAFELQTDPGVTGDFDGDGDLDCADINALVVQIRDGMSSPQFDVNADGSVTIGDIDEWLIVAGNANISRPYLLGDANLDGIVDPRDLNVVGQAWLGQVTGWCAGDFTADGKVDALDLNKLGQNWQKGAPLAAANPRSPRAALSAVAIATAVDIDTAISEMEVDHSTRSSNGLISNRSDSPSPERSSRRQRQHQSRIRGTANTPLSTVDSAMAESVIIDDLLADWV